MPRILVAVADEAERQALQSWLTGEGYEVLGAGEGTAVLGLAALARPDLVLVDERLPGVPGLTVCRRLRAAPGMLIVVLGGGRAEPDKVRAFEHGADDHVSIPYSRAELGARIRALLRGRRGHGQAGRREQASRPAEVVEVGQLRIDRASMR
ncbi:MAG: response regulator transcription factor [Candidatus Nanopelagicales bacterium]